MRSKMRFYFMSVFLFLPGLSLTAPQRIKRMDTSLDASSSKETQVKTLKVSEKSEDNGEIWYPTVDIGVNDYYGSDDLTLKDPTSIITKGKNKIDTSINALSSKEHGIDVEEKSGKSESSKYEESNSSKEDWIIAIRKLFMKWGYKYEEIPEPFGSQKIPEMKALSPEFTIVLKEIQNSLPGDLKTPIDNIVHMIEGNHDSSGESKETQTKLEQIEETIKEIVSSESKKQAANKISVEVNSKSSDSISETLPKNYTKFCAEFEGPCKDEEGDGDEMVTQDSSLSDKDSISVTKVPEEISSFVDETLTNNDTSMKTNFQGIEIFEEHIKRVKVSGDKKHNDKEHDNIGLETPSGPPPSVSQTHYPSEDLEISNSNKEMISSIQELFTKYGYSNEDTPKPFGSKSSYLLVGKLPLGFRTILKGLICGLPKNLAKIVENILSEKESENEKSFTFTHIPPINTVSTEKTSIKPASEEQPSNEVFKEYDIQDHPHGISPLSPSIISMSVLPDNIASHKNQVHSMSNFENMEQDYIHNQATNNAIMKSESEIEESNKNQINKLPSSGQNTGRTNEHNEISKINMEEMINELHSIVDKPRATLTDEDSSRAIHDLEELSNFINNPDIPNAENIHSDSNPKAAGTNTFNLENAMDSEDLQQNEIDDNRIDNQYGGEESKNYENKAQSYAESDDLLNPSRLENIIRESNYTDSDVNQQVVHHVQEHSENFKR